MNEKLAKHIEYVNHELNSVGLEEIEMNNKLNVLSLILNLIYKNKKSLISNEETKDKNTKIAHDYQQISNNYNSIKTEFDRVLKENKSYFNLTNALKDENDKLKNKAKDLTGAMNKLTGDIKNLKHQHLHEVRQLNTQNLRLRNHINAKNSSKNLSKSVNSNASNTEKFKLLNPIATTLVPCESNAVVDKNLELYKILLKDYEGREKELLNENNEIKLVLYELLQFLQKQSAKDEQSDECKSLELPFEYVKESIVSSTRNAIQSFIENNQMLIEQYSSNNNAGMIHSEEYLEVKQKLNEYAKTIDEQQVLLDLKLTGQVVMAGDPVSNATFDESLIVHLERLDSEREKLKHAAIRLGNERSKLKMQSVSKLSSPVDRRSSFSSAISSKQTPKTPLQKKSKSFNQKASALKSSTPVESASSSLQILSSNKTSNTPMTMNLSSNAVTPSFNTPLHSILKRRNKESREIDLSSPGILLEMKTLESTPDQLGGRVSRNGKGNTRAQYSADKNLVDRKGNVRFQKNMLKGLGEAVDKEN